MIRKLASKRTELAELCLKHGVARLEVFGSALHDSDFRPARSDVDFLVTFEADRRDDLLTFLNFKDALEELVGQPVDLVEREAVEASRNYIRRQRILGEAEAVYG